MESRALKRSLGGRVNVDAQNVFVAEYRALGHPALGDRRAEGQEAAELVTLAKV